MVNNILSINVTYNNQHHILECTQRDFLKEAAKKFKIDDVRNLVLYEIKDKKRRRILESEITNLMKIELMDKRLKNGQQRTIDSYTQQSNKYEGIISKLKANSPLNGEERKNLVALLQSDPVPASNKRKIDDDCPEPKKIHKKVQVNMPLTYSKDSTTQTEKHIFPALDERVIEDERIADKMKRLVSKPDEYKREIADMMAQSFEDRRRFIKMKLPPVSIIKEEYPFLFVLDEVKKELSRIFYPGKTKDFINNMFKYAPIIVQKCKSDDLLKITKKYMEKSATNKQKKYAQAVGSVFILTDLMDEQWRFIHLQDSPSGSNDIYPHIDASYHKFKELFRDDLQFHINVEGLKLCDASDFLESVLCLVAAFFIFNIDYPPSCRRTMIMFEKLYLEAKDTEEVDDHTSQMVKLLELEGNALNRK